MSQADFEKTHIMKGIGIVKEVDIAYKKRLERRGLKVTRQELVIRDFKLRHRNKKEGAR